MKTFNQERKHDRKIKQTKQTNKKIKCPPSRPNNMI